MIPIFFGAMFVQAAAGFGAGLIAMPFLIQLLGVSLAAPLFAITVQTGGIMLFWRYRKSFSLQAVWRMTIAALLAIPIGVIFGSWVDQHIALGLLGVVIIGYALYVLVGAQLPKLQSHLWSVGLGFIAGLLHGAYNTGGPPMIIYGTSQQWPPFEFKSNLAAMFFISGLFVIGAHFATGHMTAAVWQNYVIAVPAMFIGQMLGFSLDRYLNPVLFRKVVLVLLLVLGLTMVF